MNVQQHWWLPESKMVTPRLLPPPAGPRPVRASPAPGQAPLGHSYPARPALCPPPAASSSGRGKGGGGFGGAATPSPPPPAAVGATNDPQVPSTTMPTRAEGRADADAVADRLLAVFAGRDPASWRALIAASGEWPNLRARVLDRADEAAGEATDAAARLAARRLARKLRAVADELAAYDAELSRYLAADPGEWESMVAYGRASLPAAFFEHAAERVRAAAIAVKAGTPMPGLPPPADFAAAVTRLGALAAGVDVATSDPAAADAAAAEFHALLGEPDSLAAAEARIDDLAASGRLDPAFMMTAAKAYQATKESDYTRDEVKEIMYKLYRRARHSFFGLPAAGDADHAVPPHSPGRGGRPVGLSAGIHARRRPHGRRGDVRPQLQRAAPVVVHHAAGPAGASGGGAGRVRGGAHSRRQGGAGAEGV